MSLLDDVKRARGENTTQAQQQFTTSTSSSSNSLLQRVKIARGELQPQSPVVQPTAPTQTFTQKVGGFISGAAEKTKTLVSTGFQKLIGDNDTILQLSQDDLLKRIYKAKMSGQDASNMQKTLLAVNEAQKPEASPLKKITTGLAVRTMRAGVQLQSSAAGFGASLLDSITQITERRLKDDIKILESNPLYKPEEIQKIKDKPIKTREISNAIKKWSDETRVDNPVFAEKVVEGAGSMIGYTMIALATKSASPLTYNLLESLTESGSVYEEQRKKGKSIEEASKSADITLVGNLVVNRLLNIFDAKYEQLKPIKRAFQNAGIEGTQEAAQQIISNVTTDRPWHEGVLEAAGIGATLGGITTVVLPTGERVTLDENTKKITKVEPGKPPVIIQPQEASVQEEEKPVEVIPVVPVTKQQPDLSKVTSEKDKQDYETILKPKIDALPSVKSDEVVVIQTGASEYVDTQIDEALSRGVNENTKVMVVNKNDISLTDNNEKNLRGERLLKTPTTGIKQTIKQDHLEALKSEARKYKSADGGFYGTDEAGWKLVNNSNGKISTERLYLLKQEAELYPNVKKFIENFDDSDLTKSQLTDIYNQATAEKKQSNPEVRKKIEDYISKRNTVKFREADEKNLIAQHNLSEANILHADKMGGLPLPSIAISRKETPLEGFGEITLIADNRLYDPANRSNKVFNSDAYSPRYPSVTYQFDTKKAERALNPIFEEIKGYYKDSHFSPRYLESNYSKAVAMLQQSSFEDDGRRALENDFLLQGYFAKQNGATKDNDITEVRKIIEKNNNEYQIFIDDLFNQIDPSEKLFKGYTYSGRRKYQEHTLDNVVKTMKSEMKSGESFLYGVGTLRSKVANKYTKLSQIKKDRNKITSAKNMVKIKSGFEDRWSDLIEKGTNGYAVGDSQSFTNAVIDGIKRGNIQSELSEYGYNTKIVPDLIEFLKVLKDAPTEYFEVKVQRRVGLDEFIGAIVPKDTQKRVIDILKKNGLKVVTYNENTESRSEKISENFSREMFRVKDDVKQFTGKSITDEQEKQLIDLNRKIFGDDDVKITLQIMANTKALGSSKDGIITIVDGQADPKATFYHEAVHKYIDVFTTREEQVQLFEAGVEKYKTDNLNTVEENIAEDFIKYAKDREGITGAIRKIFDKIISRIKLYLGNEDKITKLYQEILNPIEKKSVSGDKFTSRVFERLQEENKDLTGELLVDRVRLQEDAEKAVDLIAKDKQKAYRIAMGEEKSDAITSTATNIAMAEEALREGNTKLYADLVKNRSIAQTRRGQEISAERGSVTDNSTSRYVKELLSIRLENVGRSYLKDLRPGKATDKEQANNVIDRKVAAFEKKVKANKIDVKTALKLLDEITCI